MSTIKPAPKPQDQFDAVKLDQMVEPLTIIVERVRGSARSRVPLPESQDGISPSGMGYTKQDILGFEPWMVKEWTGGGSFIFNVSDSSAPPITMRWTAGYPLDKYPELIPPPMRSTVVAPLPTPVPQVLPMSAFPNGLPSVPTMHAPMPTQPQGGMMGYAPQYAPQPIYPQNWNQAQQADFDKRNLEARLIETEMKRMADREAQLQRDFESRLAAQKLEAERSLEALKTMIATLTMKLESGSSKNPEIEAMRAENARLAAQADNDRREREAERRDTAMREMIRASEERAQRAADAVQAQFTQMMTLIQTQSANKGPDPMIAMLMEQARIQADVQKEIARENRAGIESMKGLILPPREMVSMMKEASAGADQITRQVTDAMGNVLGFQARVMEQSMQMQGTGGKTVVDIVDGAIERASGLAEKYALAKSHEARAASQAQAQVAQAQAQAVTAQAQSEIVKARAAAGVAEPARPTVVHTPPPPKQEKQLGGAAPTPAPAANANASKEPRRSVSGSPALTDTEWFTPQAMAQVAELRAGVTRLVESLSMTPPRLLPNGEPDGATAEQCAGWILQAMAFAIQNNFAIPALQILLAEKRYADFMDVLLPDAPQKYRDHVIKLIVAQLEPQNETDEDDDDEDEDEPDRSVGQATDAASAEQH